MIDDFATGLFDVQDIKDISGEDRDVQVAANFAHVLSERSAMKNYKSIIGKGKNENRWNTSITEDALFPAHLRANVFESSVVENYFETIDGTPVRLSVVSQKEDIRTTHTTMTLNYGNSLRIQYVYPTSNKNANSSTVLKAPNIKKK